MLICVPCKLEMTCKKNSFGARWHKSHYYSGDLYQCKGCGTETIITAVAAIEDTTSPGISMTEPIKEPVREACDCNHLMNETCIICK